jgi:integrase
MTTSLVTTKKQEFLTSSRLPLDQNPAAVYLAKLRSIHSRDSLHWCLDLAAEILSGGRFDGLTFPWEGFRYQHLAALRAKLQQPNPRPIREEPYSISTINMTLAAIKGTIREAWRLGLIPDSDYQRLTDEKGVRGTSPQSGRALSEDEKRLLLEACERDPTICGIRDIAILVALMGAGLRRSEVVDLDLEDWQREESVLVIRRGKGMKFREVPVGESTKQAIGDWVSLRGRESGPLFYAVRWKDRLERRRLTGESIWSIVCKRAEEAKIERVSPHDFRRTYITNLLDSGNDLAIVAKLAGHSSVGTTALYDRRHMGAMRQAAITVKVPYLARRER